MQGKRFAFLYSSVSLTGAFGGLLATGINSLDGSHEMAGWRWIFMIEGLITILFGLLAFIFMSNYPDTASWLTPAEKAAVIHANQADRALRATEEFNWIQIHSAFTDYRTYLWGSIYFTTYIPVYSVILSLPSVLEGLGYEGTTATLMACPPYAFGFFIVLLAGYTSDRLRDRFLHYLVAIAVVMASLVVLMIVANNVVRYTMFFFVMFMFIPISIIWSWLANNTAGTNKRAAVTGLVFSMGNIGGAISGQIYRSEWAPRYVQGHAINLGCYAFAVVAGTVLWRGYRMDNEARDKAGREEDMVEVDMAEVDLGDLGDRYKEPPTPPLFDFGKSVYGTNSEVLAQTSGF